MPVTFRTSVAILVAVTCNNGAAMAEPVFGRKLNYHSGLPIGRYDLASFRISVEMFGAAVSQRGGYGPASLRTTKEMLILVTCINNLGHYGRARLRT